MKVVAWIVIFVGAALTALNMAGLMVRPEFGGESPGGGPAVPGYHYLIDDSPGLDKLLRGPADNFSLEDANREVFESIVHTNSRRVTVYENWLLYLCGLIYRPAGKTQIAGRIAAGRGGNCSEASAVMVRIAEINGLKARFVALGGHVVAEVLTEQGWRVADPDYGVTFEAGIAELEQESGAAATREAMERRGYPDSTVTRYVEYFQSAENNSVLEPGVPSSPDLYKLERAAEWLKWIVPVLLLGAGAFYARKEEKAV
ncbi:MAG: transglutaminase domain-containing protein [Candidatus Krumholzibacteriales bacterium]